MENFPGGPVVKNLPSNAALEEGMTTHSSILVWRILCTEEPGRLQSMGSQKSQTQLSNERFSVAVIKHVLGSPLGWSVHYFFGHWTKILASAGKREI